MQRFYVAVIERGKGGFGVFFPDLPGLTSWGADVAEASANAVVAAQAHAALALEYGEDLPIPTPPNAIATEKGVKEAARLLVPVEVADERVRVNISLPKSVLAALDARAAAQGFDRSTMIVELVNDAVERPGRGARGMAEEERPFRGRPRRRKA